MTRYEVERWAAVIIVFLFVILAIFALAFPARSADLTTTLTPTGGSFRWGQGIPLTYTIAHAALVPAVTAITVTCEWQDVAGVSYSTDAVATFNVSRPVGLTRVKIPAYLLIRAGTLKLGGVAVVLDSGGYYQFPPGTELVEGMSKVFTFTIL